MGRRGYVAAALAVMVLLVGPLVADMRKNPRRDLGWNNDPCRGRRWIDQDVVGQTRWGDVVVVRWACGTFMLDDPHATAPEDQEFWYPSPRAQRILDGLRR